MLTDKVILRKFCRFISKDFPNWSKKLTNGEFYRTIPLGTHPFGHFKDDIQVAIEYFEGRTNFRIPLSDAHEISQLFWQRVKKD